MNVKNLNDQILVQKTEVLVREEREVLKNLLHCFREIERRRLFCDYKYGSLHKMLVGHFGYSDDEAYRRTSAMKLIRELPEVEEKIANGVLSLSHLGLAQTFFKKEAKIQKAEISKEIKIELLSQISDQPIREAQKIVLQYSSSPEELRPDKVTVITDEKLEYRFTADQNLESKLVEVKGLLAHKYPTLSMGELLDVLCDISIEALRSRKTATLKARKMEPSTIQNTETMKNRKTETLDVQKTATHRRSRVSNQTSSLSSKTKLQNETENSIKLAAVRQNAKAHLKKSKPNSVKVISYAQTKREVWNESRFQCSNCQSRYAMETDHRLAIAKGGTNAKTNLRILCRSCNQRSAIKQLGVEKMDGYLD